jgi:hypothetical protein
MEIREPTIGELESIESFLRLDYAASGFTPKRVSRARDEQEAKKAWRNEALRFYYLVLRKHLNPHHKIITLEDLNSMPRQYMQGVDDV